MLALLWVPVTAHCQLEKLPGFEFLQCDPSTPSSSSDCSVPIGGPCQDDPCFSIESGAWKVETFRRDVSTPASLLKIILVAALTDLATSSSDVAVRGFERPHDIPKLWRVTCLTVLAPRPPPIAA